MMPKPRLAISIGDPLGIGPDIIQLALQDSEISSLADWIVFGNQNIVKEKIDAKQAGEMSWDSLRSALEAVQIGDCEAIVTAPVSKTHLREAGFPYPGQTEYIANIFQEDNFAMMLASPELKVVLTTIHIPLKDVVGALSSSTILRKLEILNHSLKNDFAIDKPQIGVCGLNPHAGENGILGDEEKQIIQPAIEEGRQRGLNLSDPIAPDTIFYRARKGEFDAVLAHYHDQGLIPLKTLSFDLGVNCSIGLPIIRTSPDHGPAFDIKDKSQINPSSMKEAMKMAYAIWKNRQSSKKSI